MMLTGLHNNRYSCVALRARRTETASKPAQSASAATCVASPDDAAIYSAALTKVILKDRDDKRQLVLLSQTSAAYPPALAAFTALAKPDRTGTARC